VRSPLKPGVDLPALPLPVPTPPGWDVNVSVNGEWQPVPGMAGIGGAGSFPVTSPVVFDQWLPTQGTLHVHAQGLSLGCQDTIRGQSLGNVIAHFFTGDTAQAQALAQVCLLANRVDGGEVDAQYQGPQFGAGGSLYEVASKGGAVDGAYSLRFKIERLSDDTVAQR
jgi:hypothetical protein